MNQSQHGFRQGHSTTTQLLTYYDSMLSLLEKDDTVDAIYLDFSKAFDKVDHNILLVKLKRLGISGKLLKWIEEFLKRRFQKVRVQGCLSNPVKVISGVPQGSVLGPLLFLVMMLDIDKQVTFSAIATYADDTKIWATVNTREDTQRVQSDLTRLYEWARNNNMEFNAEKFEHLTFTQYPPLQPLKYSTPTGTEMKFKETVNDLGITFSRSGKFQTHIAEMVRSAQRLSHWILRTFHTRDRANMKILLKSLIIPKVEYASPVWYPSDRTSINLIESVQKVFTRRMSEFVAWREGVSSLICQVNYWDRLKSLHLYSLQRRRDRYLILFIYKMVAGIQ